MISQAIYTFQHFGNEAQFGDITLVRWTDSATRRLAWACRFASSLAWVCNMDRVALLVRRLAVLNLVRRLHFWLLHFGAHACFANFVRWFAISILFALSRISQKSQVLLISATLGHFARRQFLSAQWFVDFGDQGSILAIFSSFVVLLHWFCTFCVPRTLKH